MFALSARNKFFHNHRGGILIFVLFAILVVMFLGGIIMDQTSRSKRQEILRAQRDEMLHMVRALRDQLRSGVLCPQILAGQTFTPTSYGIDQVLQINTGYNNNPGPIKAGWSYSNNYLALATVSLRFISPAQQMYLGSAINRTVRLATNPTWPTAWAGSIPASEGVLTKYKALVILTPQNPEIFWNTKNNPDTVIPLFVSVNSAGAISQCHGEESTAEACEAMGGAYDGRFAPPLYRCNPDFYCFKDQQYVAAVPVCTTPHKPEVLSYFGGQYFYFCSWCHP